MFKIENGTIYIHRGDSATFGYSIDVDEDTKYEFEVGDKVEFTVFQKQGYDKTPVIDKTITVTETTEEVDIDLTEQDTTIGDPANKPVTYWYEISLNGDNTVNGYDPDNGALEFILLPAKGGDINE